MPRRLRRFNQDFIRHFEMRGAWPKKEAAGIAKSGRYSELRNGDAGAEHYFFNFVACCRCNRATPERHALDEYLHKHGRGDPKDLTHEQIVDRISAPAERSIPDSLLGGVDDMIRLYRFMRHPAHCVRPCHSKLEVRAAIEWMFAEAGRLTNRSKLDVQTAIELGATHIGTPLSQYQARAIEWWKEDPWTVVIALDSGRSRGMSVTLPLRLDAYDAVRSGCKRGCECTAADLMSPSTRLLVEGIAMRHADGTIANKSPNRFLLAAIVCQQAHLSRVPGCWIDVPLHLLSFASIPANKARLMRFGYEPVGINLHGTRYELMERALHHDSGPKASLIYGVWSFLRRDIASASASARHDSSIADE